MIKTGERNNRGCYGLHHSIGIGILLLWKPNLLTSLLIKNPTVKVNPEIR